MVPSETDTTDNVKVDGTVTIIIPGHDVAIKSVTPSKTIVGKGYSLSINVTAKNYGSFTETFNITVYYNETNPLATQNFITLTSGSFITITFPWDTTGYAMGIYAIKAIVTQVPGETNTTDNICIDGTVQIATPGDINSDGHVNISDLSILADNWYKGPLD